MKSSSSIMKKTARLLWYRAGRQQLSPRGLSAAQEKIMSLLSYAKPMPEQTPIAARKSMVLLDKLLSADKPDVAEVYDQHVVTDGDDISVRVYRSGVASTRKNNPCLVYFHGGGGVIGSIDTHDQFCREIAAKTHFVVASVDYRLAPEFPFPVPVEDALRGWNWVCDNAESLGIDIEKTGVGGDSAGGWLATSVAQQAQTSTLCVTVVQKPAFQWLIYPMLDCRLETGSSLVCTEGMVLTRGLMEYFFDHLLPPHIDRADVTVSPGLNDELAGLPKTYLLTVGFDPLEDEGKSYAARMSQQGVSVNTEHYPDVMHGFIGFTGVCPASKRYIEKMLQNLVNLVV